MTSRSHTFSSGLAGSVLILLACPALAGTVGGKVELVDSTNSAVRSKKDFSGVVIWLEPVGPAPLPVSGVARMVQKDKTFTPHILAIQTGTTVDFPNFDPIFHNAFSNFNGQLFDVGLYAPGTSRSVRFIRPGVVRVFCNIHAAMSAVIVVVNTPYLASTRKDGGFEWSGVPPGEYTLRVFHERATQPVLDQLSRRVTVSADPLSLGTLSISESGYLEVPHHNKYGREYGSEPDDSAYGKRK